MINLSDLEFNEDDNEDEEYIPKEYTDEIQSEDDNSRHTNNTNSKIAHRTRSKCPINSSALELESSLPDDLLLNAETPSNKETDEIWHQFLINLQKETDQFFAEDEKDDPDFTFVEQETDNDLDANQLIVPIKEAAALVKDAVEFCGATLYEDNSTKAKSNKINFKRTSSEKDKLDLDDLFNLTSLSTITATAINNDELSQTITTNTPSNDQTNTQLVTEATDSNKSPSKTTPTTATNTNHHSWKSMNNRKKSNSGIVILTVEGGEGIRPPKPPPQPQQQTQSTNNNNNSNKKIDKNQKIITVPRLATPSTTDNNLNQYIPVFTDEERKQLDEQLRNHVQLLTQTCISCIFQYEYTNVFNQAFNLLNVFNDMQTYAKKSNNCGGNNNNSSNTNANKLNILNLEEAVKIVNEFKNTKFDCEQTYLNKYFETILSSPVFYNLNLIPVQRYKYQSQYTKSQYTDSEIRLLMYGHAKFRHLAKSECCECIKKYMLPSRSTDDISRKLSDLAKSGERKERAKRLAQETLPKFGLRFDEKNDYKSPLEKSANEQLPSMYTMTIERLRMSKLLKETKELSKEISETNKSNNQKQIAKKQNENRSPPSEWLKERLSTVELTKIAKPANNKSATSNKRKNDNDVSSLNSTIISNPNESMIIIDQDDMSRMFGFGTSKVSTNQTYQIIAQSPHTSGSFMPSFCIPAHFAGTIMIQPTINVISDDKTIKSAINSSKFRQIVPKVDPNASSKQTNEDPKNKKITSVTKKRKL